MSFADPQSVTLPAPFSATISLPRTAVGDGSSAYTSADGNVILSAASTKTGRSRVRRVLRLDHSKTSANPLIPAENITNSMSCYLVFDIPIGGYTPTEAQAIYSGLKGAMTAGTDLLITKLLGGES